MSPGLVTPAVLVVVALLASVGVMWAFSSGAKAGRKAEARMRDVNRAGGAATVAVLVGGVISGIQWAVLTKVPNPGWAVLGLVLGVPGVLAGTTVGRMYAVHEIVRRTGRPGRGGR